MVRWLGIVASVLGLAAVSACGDADGETGSASGAAQDADPGEVKRLGLTDSLPRAVQRACARAAGHSTLAVACPPIVPAGSHRIQVANRLMRKRGPEDSYSIHLLNDSLMRKSGDQENPGHWAVEAAGSLSTLRQELVDLPGTQDCQRFRERQGSKDPGSCEPIHHDRVLGGVPVTEYRMPPYPTGGVHGGHLVYLWEGDAAAYLVSVHDPANRERAIAIASALVAETTGR